MMVDVLWTLFGGKPAKFIKNRVLNDEANACGTMR
jgi:hypothetical protein